MGIISPFRPATSSATDSQAPVPSEIHPASHPAPGPVTGATSEQRGLNEGPPAHGEGGASAPLDPETWLMEDLPDIVYDLLIETFADAANLPVPPSFSSSLHEHLRAWAKNKVLSHRFSESLDLEDGDIRAFVAALAGRLS